MKNWRHKELISWIEKKEIKLEQSWWELTTQWIQKIVGRTALYIASMAGITVPTNTKILVSEETEVSHFNPYSREKLCPVLGFYCEENWEKACERCIEILKNEGIGHTMSMHSIMLM